MSEKITLNRALVQLKLNHKKIDKATRKVFITYKVGDKVQDENADPKAALDSVNSLITYGESIKAALVIANATTNVTINDEVMSIAAAIEKKKTILYYKSLLSAMTRQLSYAKSEVDETNDNVQIRLDRLLEANFGKDLKARDTEISQITKSFNEVNQAKLLDPIGLEVRIENLSEYIDGFESEVDIVLSEINAVTYIEI